MKLTKETVYTFLNTSRWTDSAALFLRIFAGGMLLSHGIMKIQDYGFLMRTFPSILGMGSETALTVTILVETGCSIAIICGFLTRVALIPTIFTMFVAAFLTGRFGELALIYMGMFVALFISGPGMYSFDRWMLIPESRKTQRRKRKYPASE